MQNKIFSFQGLRSSLGSGQSTDLISYDLLKMVILFEFL